MTKHKALRPAFAAELDNVDLTTRSEALSSVLKSLFSRHAVIVIKNNKDLCRGDLSRLASVFGQPSGCDDITNLGEDGRILDPTSQESKLNRANKTWHVDMLATKQPPLACSLYAKLLPPCGGETQFADLAKIWGSLTKGRQKRLLGKHARHSFEAIKKRTGPNYPLELVSNYPATEHPVVTIDPLSKAKVVFIGAHTERVIGTDDDVDDLIGMATTPDNIYTHKWSTGDVVIWNNRRVLHRVISYDASQEQRQLWRIESVGPPPVAAPLRRSVWPFSGLRPP